MSVDALGQSPRRMAKAPPPPVPPKRFQVKEALHDLGVQPRSPTTTTTTQEERKPSAAERLAADKGRFIKSQPIVLSKTPQMTAVPVSRKQLVPPSTIRSIPPSPSKPISTSGSSSQPKASPRRPVRKTVPPAVGSSAGAPVLDLKHLSILISGVEEPEPDTSPPASHTAAASTCSLSSDGTGGEENCNEPVVPTPTTSEPTSSFDKLPLASPASLAQISSPSPSLSLSSPSLDSPRRAGSDASGSGSLSQGGCSPAVAVRRVDVRPQMAPPVRKGMHGGPMHGRMPAHMQMQMQMPMAAHAKLQQQAQSHAHLMYLMKAQVAAKNAPVLPRNSPLMPTAKLPAGAAHGGMPGMMAHRAGISPSLPPQQSSNGSPTFKSPTIPGTTPQPVSATTPQSSAVTPITPPLPLRTSSPTAGQAAEPQTPAVTTTTATNAAPTPTSLPSSCSNLSAFLPGGGSNSPIPPFSAPSPSPSITRLSSTGSRKRPSLARSKSDVSDRFSRAGADLERFFNYCGLDPADLDLEELAQQPGGSDIASVSRLRSASAPASECSQGQEEEEGGAQAQRTPYGISVIERNARVIKWLYGLRQARDPARVANI